MVVHGAGKLADGLLAFGDRVEIAQLPMLLCGM